VRRSLGLVEHFRARVNLVGWFGVKFYPNQTTTTMPCSEKSCTGKQYTRFRIQGIIRGIKEAIEQKSGHYRVGSIGIEYTPFLE